MRLCSAMPSRSPAALPGSASSELAGLTQKQLRAKVCATPGLSDKRKDSEGKWKVKTKQELLVDLQRAEAQPLAGPRTAAEKKAAKQARQRSEAHKVKKRARENTRETYKQKGRTGARKAGTRQDKRIKAGLRRELGGVAKAAFRARTHSDAAAEIRARAGRENCQLPRVQQTLTLAEAKDRLKTSWQCVKARKSLDARQAWDPAEFAALEPAQRMAFHSVAWALCRAATDGNGEIRGKQWTLIRWSFSRLEPSKAPCLQEVGDMRGHMKDADVLGNTLRLLLLLLNNRSVPYDYTYAGANNRKPYFLNTDPLQDTSSYLARISRHRYHESLRSRCKKWPKVEDAIREEGDCVDYIPIYLCLWICCRSVQLLGLARAWVRLNRTDVHLDAPAYAQMLENVSAYLAREARHWKLEIHARGRDYSLKTSDLHPADPDTCVRWPFRAAAQLRTWLGARVYDNVGEANLLAKHLQGQIRNWGGFLNQHLLWTFALLGWIPHPVPESWGGIKNATSGRNTLKLFECFGIQYKYSAKPVRAKKRQTKDARIHEFEADCCKCKLSPAGAGAFLIETHGQYRRLIGMLEGLRWEVHVQRVCGSEARAVVELSKTEVSELAEYFVFAANSSMHEKAWNDAFRDID